MANQYGSIGNANGFGGKATDGADKGDAAEYSRRFKGTNNATRIPPTC
jgi:hypothetical protein